MNIQLEEITDLVKEEIFSNTKTDSYWKKEIFKGKHNIFNLLFRSPSKPFFLVTATQDVSYERKSGILLSGFGCLGNIVYCVPAYEENNNFILHNYGTRVLEHIDDTKITPLMFKVESNLFFKFNYLMTGSICYLIADKIEETKNDNFILMYKREIASTLKFTKNIIDRYTSCDKITTIEDAEEIINRIANNKKLNSIIPYIYYECTVISLQIHSSDSISKNLLKKNEVNSSLFIDIAYYLKDQKGEKRFNISDFNIQPESIRTIINRMNDKHNSNISYDKFIVTCSNLIVAMVGKIFNSKFSVEGYSLYTLITKDTSLVERYWNLYYDTLSEIFSSYDIVQYSLYSKGEYGLIPKGNKVESFECSYSNDKKMVLKIKKVLVKLCKNKFKLIQVTT